jgi:uncharacterized protein YndB with AHSA1/START domain
MKNEAVKHMMDDTSLIITRVFDAPREKVWEAWTTPESWVSWYGKPYEVPSTAVEMDSREGGRWRSTTIAEGNEITFTGEYKEVTKPEKLVLTFENPDDPRDPDGEIGTVVLKDVNNGKTAMTFKQEGNLPTEEYQTGLKKGRGGFFDALEIYLT